MLIETERLIMRPPQLEDAAACNEAIQESFNELRIWMPWAKIRPKLEETEAFVRQTELDWLQKRGLALWIYDRESGEFLGGTGFHHLDWSVPSFEIGYWLRTSRTGEGLMTEGARALTDYAFDIMKAKRVEIRCDERNSKSRAIPERLGYHLETILIKNEIGVDGVLRNTCVYLKK